MLGTDEQNIKDLVIEEVARHPYVSGPSLVQLIETHRPNTTKQAVYLALRSLLGNEVIGKVGSKYFLSNMWLNKMDKIIKSPAGTGDAIFGLKDKESISYHFPSILVCDKYWAHLVNVLIEHIPKDSTSFIWNPHNWFIIGRAEVEKDIFEGFQSNKKYCFFTTLYTSPIDMEFKKKWANKYVSISTNNKLGFKPNYYLNVFGDFILEIFIDKKLASDIEKFYKENDKITDENAKKFQSLISKKHPIRMKVSKNTEKAEEFRKKLSKDFYIPKSK